MKFLRRNRTSGSEGEDVQDLFSVAEKVLNEPIWKHSSKGRNVQAPPMDLSESEEDYLIELEAPGLNPERLEVTVSDHTLTIKGEKVQEQDDEAREYHRIERRFGTFTRQVRLPDMANEEDIQAEYERGIVRIFIPKSVESETKHIDVSVRE